MHVDDLVSALELVIREDRPGTFNVASDGWLEDDEVCRLLPRANVASCPAVTLERSILDGLAALPMPKWPMRQVRARRSSRPSLR